MWGFSWVTNRDKKHNNISPRFKADNDGEGANVGGKAGWGLRHPLLMC